MAGILGKKLGMTQVFGDDGEAIPVTVLEVGPCLVVQRKTTDRDGYDAVQVGLVEDRTPRGVTRPMQGHFDRADVAPLRKLKEFRIDPEAELSAGDEIKASIFEEGTLVTVTGTAKGKGFQGVVKRHGHHGGKATHGSMFHRAPGSIGQASDPSRVFPGVKLPGRTGGNRVTVKNLQVVRVDDEKNLLLVKGAVPGSKGSYVAVRQAQKSRGA
ncbi:MAG: 50S ribosomal protein L3 [Thermoanaerobaculia bacterium]|nr:50S ribosomal protein L3 [Thermoanaerobaculia bacterium]